MQPRTIVLAGAKGGQGTTVTAVALAIKSAGAGHRTHLAAHDPGDLASVLGLPRPDHWSPAMDAVPGLSFGPLDYLPGALDGFGDEGPELVVIDAGRLVDVDAGQLDATTFYVVLRGPCYLAISRAVAGPVRPAGALVIQEPGRALGADDVADVLGVPVFTIPADPAVARAVDAGLLAARLPVVFDRLPAPTGV